MRRQASIAARRTSLISAWILPLAVIGLGLSCGPEPPNAPVDVTLDRCVWFADDAALMVVTIVPEPDPFRTHGRLELSWTDVSGRELFRALYNTCSRPNPVPPQVFGVLNLETGAVESAGIEARWEVALGGFALTPDSVAVRREGTLVVNWAFRPSPTVNGHARLRARVIPKRGGATAWQPLASIERRDGGWRPVDTLSSPSGRSSPPP